MARGKRAPVKLPEKEVAAKSAYERFVKTHEGKNLTDSQKAEKAKLRDAYYSLKFVRIANKRIPRVLAQLKGIGQLGGSGYVSTPEQVKAIKAALSDALNSAMAKLSGEKETASSFTLPSTDEGAE